MFGKTPPPPQAGGTPHFKQSSTPSALGGFSVCVAAPVALLAIVPIWTLTAAPVFDLISNSQPAFIALIGQIVWVGAASLGVFFMVSGLVQTVLGSLGARLKMSLFNFRGFRR